uniref:Gypsy retrotransposon integrase-like protein 1 n=1 Tax=Gasterosteus aculeatus aculeatus TaxID=481459 RepID=A0AAQ4NRX0_GASAC
MLRDRLVCGINDDRIQRRLLSETDLTFEKAFKIAVAAEAASKNVQDLHKAPLACNSMKTEGSLKKEGDWRKRDKECYRCQGKQHSAAECKFKEAKCHCCGKIGHIAKACRNKNKGGARPIGKNACRAEWRSRPHRSHNVDCERQDGGRSEEEAFTLACIKTETSIQRIKPFEVTMEVNKKTLHFEIDTGCSVSIMNEMKFKEMWNEKQRPQIKQTNLLLKSYTGEKIKVVGVAEVEVNYERQVKTLPLVVVKGTGPSLLGRGWLEALKLKWEEIKNVRTEAQSLQDVLVRNEDVFKQELGMLKGMKATIRVSAEAHPKFYRPRSVPYAMRAKVEEEIDRLLKEDIITPVKYAEWAAPIVPVLKPNGSVRICGDYKLTVNSASSLEQYPIPRVEDLINTLSGGKQFSKLDLSHAYQQIVMDDTSKKYLTINTHRGLFTYNRLPFGVSSAPAIFQRTMENLLQGLPRVAVYLDDIILTGRDEAEHLSMLDEVLRRLKDAGLRLHRSKCAFLQNEVEYLGHKVNAEGLHPVQSKVRAIEEAPPPTTVTELKAYLGLLNYYNKFLPSLATRLAPLHKLLRKDVLWTWNNEQDEAFQNSKQLLKSAKVLCHYSADKDLVLACDALPYGIGAVLSHVMEDGSEKPIGFMSRTLTPAEKRYSQLDKEGLAIIFGIKRFHKYIYGRTFTISTDHKPLISLFHEKKPVPQMGSPRVQRWATLLRAYEYKIIYKPGKEHANADALSRLPLPQTGEEDDTDQVLMLEVMDDPPITTAQVKQWTARDETLSQVLVWCLKGWPREVDARYKPYSQRRLELSVKDGCVLWGARVVIPQRGRKAILQQLHHTHPGISRMKGLARSYVWWPGMDSEIEKEVQSCHTCQENRNLPAGAPLHPWEWPETPWSRLHIDYAGPFLGKMFLVIVDAHSKWIDVYPATTATSQVTIEKLRQCFSIHGLP